MRLRVCPHGVTSELPSDQIVAVPSNSLCSSWPLDVHSVVRDIAGRTFHF